MAQEPVVKKTPEEIRKEIIDRQKEQLKKSAQKIKEKHKNKLRKVNLMLAKVETERVTEAGKALKKLYKERAGSLELKDFIAICEKYWPTPKD